MDLVGEITPATAEGYNFILTVVDCFTLWLWLVPMRGTSTASVAEASAAPAREDWGAVEDWGLTNCLSDPLTNCASRFTSMISQLQQPVGFCNSSFRYI